MQLFDWNLSRCREPNYHVERNPIIPMEEIQFLHCINPPCAEGDSLGREEGQEARGAGLGVPCWGQVHVQEGQVRLCRGTSPQPSSRLTAPCSLLLAPCSLLLGQVRLC